MSLRRFLVLLKCLSGDALFRTLIRDEPLEVEGHAAASAAIERM